MVLSKRYVESGQGAGLGITDSRGDLYTSFSRAITSGYTVDGSWLLGATIHCSFSC